MIRVVTYLLPMSGKILLEKLDAMQEVEVAAAFVPETYYSDCQAQIHWLEDRDVPYRVPGSLENDSLKKWVQQFELDYGLSVGYDKKLPEWLYHHPDGGTINFHPSLLPEYRGANPYFWALRNREKKTGVTLHFMDEGLDTGPIIKQEEIPIVSGETMGTLFFKLNQSGMNLLEDVIEEILETGKSPSASPQPKTDDPHSAPRVQSRHLRIDWSEDFKTIEAHVRAANPFLGAFTTFKGSKIRIYEAEKTQSPQAGDDSPPPGRIHATDQGPAIRCRNNWVHPSVVQVGQSYTASGLEFQRREQQAFDVLDKVI